MEVAIKFITFILLIVPLTFFAWHRFSKNRNLDHLIYLILRYSSKNEF